MICDAGGSHQKHGRNSPGSDRSGRPETSIHRASWRGIACHDCRSVPDDSPGSWPRWMIVLVPGRVEGFILDLPSRTPGTHDLFGVLGGDLQLADPLPVSLEAFLVDLVVLQGIDR